MPDVELKVATYNANSIRTRLEQVLEWLGQGKADVLCIQETKVQDRDFPQDPFREAGYHVAFRGQKAHGGVAIVSRQEPQDVSFGFDDGGEPDGPRLARALIAGIPIVNTYVPQGRSPDSEHFQYKLEWLARMRALFERYYAPDAPLLWVGDFNVAPDPIDVHDPKRLKDHVAFHPDCPCSTRARAGVGICRRLSAPPSRRAGPVQLLGLSRPGGAGPRPGLAGRPRLGHRAAGSPVHRRVDRRRGPPGGAAVGPHLSGGRVCALSVLELRLGAECGKLSIVRLGHREQASPSSLRRDWHDVLRSASSPCCSVARRDRFPLRARPCAGDRRCRSRRQSV